MNRLSGLRLLLDEEVGEKHGGVHLVLFKLRLKLIVLLDFTQEEHVRLGQFLFELLILLLDLLELNAHGFKLECLLQSAFLG